MAELIFTLKGLKLGFEVYLLHFSPIYHFVLQYYCDTKHVAIYFRC